MKRAVQVLLPVVLASSSLPSVSQSRQLGTAPQEAARAPSAEQLWQTLVAGNKRFVVGKMTSRNLVYQRRALLNKQNPWIAVLSCSDSRVPPEIVFDQGLGNLFVVRAAGNSVDPVGIGSFEYAVEHLGTVMIVVLGHQSCGAVSAACSGEKMPSPNLEAVVRPVTQSCTVAKEQHSGESLVEFATREHIHRTAQDLLSQSTVLKRAHDEGKLTIIEAYYSMDSGAVTRLH